MGDSRRYYDGRETREPFKIIIHNGELAQIRQWVTRHPHIETGGDLFGLWSKGNTAVVQLVLGPGNNSKRTKVSFFQDEAYLGKVGSHLTQQYGLCHIGEWHSHHSLGLAEPSEGDERTVWSNLPKYGFKRFVIFIANIDKTSRLETVGLGCFLFETDTTTRKKYPVMPGLFEVINDQAPYRRLKSLLVNIYQGAESTYNDSEVDVKTDLVRSGAKRYTGQILLQERSTVQSSHQQNPVRSTEITPSLRDHSTRPHPLTVDISPTLNCTSFTPLWARADQVIKKLLEQLSYELAGQISKEFNTITVQFLVTVRGLSDTVISCRLVYDGQNFLGLHVATLPSYYFPITFETIGQQPSASRAQFVKEQVRLYVVEYISAVMRQLTERSQQMSGLRPSGNATAATQSAFRSNQPIATSSHGIPSSQVASNQIKVNPGYREDSGSSTSGASPMDIDQEQPLMEHGHRKAILQQGQPVTRQPRGQVAHQFYYQPCQGVQSQLTPYIAGIPQPHLAASTQHNPQFRPGASM